MNVLETIIDQTHAIGEPLFAVTLTALPRRNTPVLLMLHWHGFRLNPPFENQSYVQVKHSPVPSTALQINKQWQDISDLDQAMLDAAWQLGAWQLEREQRRSCTTIGVPIKEAMECQQAFGENPYHPQDESHLVAEAPDRQELLEAGARLGYIRWQFRPVRGGVWNITGQDETLNSEGGRTPPCPPSSCSQLRKNENNTRILLGKISRIMLI